MIQIVSGTDRPNSRTLAVSQLVHNIYQTLGAKTEIIDLAKIEATDFHGGNYISGPTGTLKIAVDKITASEGVVLIVPEYNGSFPGILKLFIDYWKYPESFESRPFCYVGLGIRWGGLRPVEHLQQALGYRNGFNFPTRVFLPNIHTGLKEGALVDAAHLELLKAQAQAFLP
jgi:chromate reductase